MDGSRSYPRVTPVLVALTAVMAPLTLLVIHFRGPSDSIISVWSLRVGAGMYDQPAFSFAAREYAPVFAQLTSPLTSLPLEQFTVIWAALQMVMLLWLLGPRWLGLALLLPPIQYALWNGNVQNFYAIVVALGLRYPGLWAYPIFTKVTPGLGLAWFAFRREWRSLAIALATTAVLAVVSFAAAPGMWIEWIRWLIAQPASTGGAWPADLQLPLALRLAAALALLAWGSPRGHRWTLAVAIWLSMPIAWWLGLVALLGLLRPAKTTVSARATASMPEALPALA